MALDDKTLLLGGAMILMALVVVVFWDALALDERDLAVLAPLPVRPADGPRREGRGRDGRRRRRRGGAQRAARAALPDRRPAQGAGRLPDVLCGPSRRTLLAGLAGCAFVFFTLSSLRGAAGLFKSRQRRAAPPAAGPVRARPGSAVDPVRAPGARRPDAARDRSRLRFADPLSAVMVPRPRRGPHRTNGSRSSPLWRAPG